MPLPYIDTPRTEAGNATYLTNGLRSATRNNLSALDSVEDSFQSPSNDHDLVKNPENSRSRGISDPNMRTPRAKPRTSVKSRRDSRGLPSTAASNGEFTPLLKSVTKNNVMRNKRGSEDGNIPDTPAFLADGYRSNGNTPGLPKMDMTEVYDEGTYSAVADEEATPVPRLASSSVQGTPLAAMSGRDGEGPILGEGQNMMSLKEQGNVRSALPILYKNDGIPNYVPTR